MFMKQLLVCFCVLFAVIPCLFTTGCSPREEAGNLAVVTGIYVDYSIENSTYAILAEIADFSGYEKTSTLSAKWLKANGNTLSDAIFQLKKTSPDPLYFSHAKLLLLGKGFQAVSPKSTLIFFLNEPGINSDILVCLANMTEEELMHRSEDTISGKIFQTIQREYNTENCRLYRLFGKEALPFFLPEISLLNGENQTFSTAVFSNYLYLTSYEKDEEVILRLLTDGIQNRSVSTNNFNIIILNGNCVIAKENGQPIVNCTLSVRIDDIKGNKPLLQENNRMKQELERTLSHSANQLYQDLKRVNKTDILGNIASAGNVNIRFFITVEESQNLKGR